MELDRLRAHTFEARNATFPLPHVVRKDMFVKVGARGERFWCKVRSVGDGTLRVIVERDLLWPRGHELVIQHEHVLEVADATDGLTFQSLVVAL